MPGEQYLIEFVGDPQGFAPAANTVLSKLRQIEVANKAITRSTEQGLVAEKAKAALAQQRRANVFQELIAVQKLAMMEERRVRIAQRLADAQSRGLVRRANILGQGLMAMDAGMTLLGAGTGTGFRRRMKQANIIDVTDVSRGGGASAAAAEGSSGLAPVVGGGGLSAKSMVKSLAVVGGVMSLIRDVLSTPARAVEKSDAAQKEVEAAKKMYEWSGGAVRNLSLLALGWTHLTEGLKKFLAEAGGLYTGSMKMVFGMYQTWIAKATGSSTMRKRGESWMVDATMNMPTWLGGLGGSDAEDVITRNKATASELLKKKRSEYVEKMLDGIRERIQRSREAYEERRRHQKHQQFEDRQFAFGGINQLMGGSANGMFAAGGSAAVAGNMIQIQRQTLEALKQNVKATQSITPAIQNLGSASTSPFVY